MKKAKKVLIPVLIILLLLAVSGFVVWKYYPELIWKYLPDREEDPGLVTDAELQAIQSSGGKDSAFPAYEDSEFSEVIGFEEPDPEQDVIGETASVVVLTANVYEYDTVHSQLVKTLSGGTQFTIEAESGDFYQISKDGEILGYIAKTDVKLGVWYARLEGAVDLRELLPEAEIDMLFASYRNIVGEPMYPAIPLMEYSAAMRLKEAYDEFRQDGYTIRVCDAYRPKSAQYKLYDLVEDTRFIANPNNGNSWHQLGRAIDMSLIKVDTGEEIHTPTPMHTFDNLSARYERGKWTEEQAQDIDYMTDVMQRHGFGIISTEWWHFEYTASGNVMDNNLDFNKISFVRVR